MTHIRYPAVTCCDKHTSIITKSVYTPVLQPRMPVATDNTRYWPRPVEFKRDLVATVREIIEYGA
jgi:hypothetical protein